ncbi:MAG TPA: cupin domain-containing protein [Thermoplasmata archaeon]|nr:cupin domain-containing protein [Thermoplasmata archaeon]
MPLWEEKPDAWHEIVPGVRRRILAHAPEVMLVLYRISPGCLFPRHTHPHVQSGTVLEGGGEFRVGDDVWKLVQGSSYVVPGGVPHELRSDPRTRTVILDVFTPRRDDFMSETVPHDRT